MLTFRCDTVQIGSPCKVGAKVKTPAYEGLSKHLHDSRVKYRVVLKKAHHRLSFLQRNISHIHASLNQFFSNVCWCM